MTTCLWFHPEKVALQRLNKLAKSAEFLCHNFVEVFRLLEVVEGIVDHRRCARAKLVVHLPERYRRLITRGIVVFNFSPRNLTQVTSAMKPLQDSMVGFASVKRITLREGLY